MDNKVDVSKYALIKEVAFAHSKLLNRGYAFFNYGGKKEEASFFYLRSIVSSDVENILERITLIHARVCSAPHNILAIGNVQYSSSDLIWARLCVSAYYFYKGDAIWEKFIFNKLEEKIPNEALKKEVIAAKQAIDKLHREQEELKVAKEEIQKATTPTGVSSQKEDVEDDLPSLLKIMQRIQDGKIRNLNEINWVEGIQEMVRLTKLMPTPYPPVCWLWAVLGIIEEPTKRMDVLGKMQDAAVRCFNSKNEESEFLRDCDSLVKINGRIREYYLKNDTDKKAIWTGDKKIHDGLAHLLLDKYVLPEELVAIAEESYCSVQNREKPQILTLILRADQYAGKMSMDNIVDFAKNLYLAEGFRQLFLSGKEEYFDIPTINSFNRKVRNACFDVYIDLRTKQIREELDKDNSRVDDPDEMECLEILLEDEKMNVDRENQFENFRGSSAYNAMWYPGREMVLELINVFVEYLQKKIGKKRSETTVPRGSIYYDVHGDIVQGDKHVGAVVENVEKGGIGVQTTEK